MPRVYGVLSTALIVMLSFTNSFAQEKKKEAGTTEPAASAEKKDKSPETKIEQYWLVILKTGSKKTDIDSATRSELFKGHMANIERLYYDGVLKVAGPFGKNDFKWRGLFIFDCKTKEEVEKLVASDPTVAAGIFDVDIVPWYGEPIGSFKHGKPDKP